MNPTVVCSMFGAGMLQVQEIERTVGLLAMAVEYEKPRNITNPERAIAKLEEMVNQYWRAFQTQAAGTQLSRFERKLPDALVADLRSWVDERNHYVHGFLVQRKAIDGGDEDDTLRPTGKLPLGKITEAARAVLRERQEDETTTAPPVASAPKQPRRRDGSSIADLDGKTARVVAFLSDQSHPARYDAITAATGVGPGSLRIVLRHARGLGLVRTISGPGGGTVATNSAPVPA